MNWSTSAASIEPARLCLRYIALALLILPGCGTRGIGALFGDGENTLFKASDTTVADAADAAADASTQPPTHLPPKDPRLCVFDYDLTLSSHDCSQTAGDPTYFCRENTCDTYGWYPQCLAIGARAAIAECVKRHAYIGIASKANVDNCWADKVLPIISQDQFPELTHPQPDPDAALPIVYPALDDRANWNCDNCAYTMDGGLSKPDGIRRIMRHFGLDPNLPLDRARVIFWDDTASNISDVEAQIPEARSILVPSFTGAGVDGGCGITQTEIDAGWAP